MAVRTPLVWTERLGVRIVIHDYSGHAFAVELSRELANRGHEVGHVYSGDFLSPHGRLQLDRGDPRSLRIVPLSVGKVAKYSYWRRRRQEIRYGRRLADLIRELAPDVVISANTPLDAQSVALRAAHDADVAFVFWLQDIYSIAIRAYLTDRLGLLGAAVGYVYGHIEGRMLRESDQVVAIAESFVPALASWGVDASKVRIVENWAPLGEIATYSKANPWSLACGLSDVSVVMYAGTLGLKHDPRVFLDLARRVPETRVVVVSEGPKADWLKQQAERLALGRLMVMPFQNHAELGQVLSAADVLVVILEQTASAFSVPSKVLSYMCAGRAIVAMLAAENPAAVMVKEAACGVVVEPGDTAAFIAAVTALVGDSTVRERFGRNARDYAERHFRIAEIGDTFEDVLRRAIDARRAS